MEGYIPSNNFPSMRKQEQENLDFKSDIDVFNKLDEIAEEYGFRKGEPKSLGMRLVNLKNHCNLILLKRLH